jgi:hypothetical protein
MAKRATAYIQIRNGDDAGIGNMVATLIREHIPFDLSYAPIGVVIIAVEKLDEDEVVQIIRTTT